MGLNFAYVRFFSLCICISFVLTCILNLLPLPADNCNCNSVMDGTRVQKYINPDKGIQRNKAFSSGHRLAILVPFRDRFEELLVFVPHMSQFLEKQNINNHIFVLNQVDKYRFNRASLINVGYLETQFDYDYIAMHDVDLLPLNDNLTYKYPENGPFHVASPAYHPKYHYPSFVGGVLLLTREHFKLLGGMSNQYWGWGLEDDEFYVRIKEAGLQIMRPLGLNTGAENTFRHIHDRLYRKRDTSKCFNQREVTRKRDRKTGIHNVKYNIKDIKEITIEGYAATIINIELFCDKNVTPWCECIGVDTTKPNAKNKINDKTKTVKVPRAR